MFETLGLPAPDPILGLQEEFQRDSRPNKVNLGIGVYVDETGQTPVLTSVRKAEEYLLAHEPSKSYLGMAGDPSFNREIQKLILGVLAEKVASRVRCLQTPGGTGALRVGAELVRLSNPTATVWVSQPTWANHQAIFSAAGLAVKTYPYYDDKSKGLDRERLFRALASIPAGDVVLLHVSCHNPTGVDPTLSDWEQIARMAAQQRWTAFFDFAYQGFGKGLEADAEPLRPFVLMGVEFLLAHSLSKNFALYCERTGALLLVAGTEKDANTAFENAKIIVRRMYSNPPAHGARIAARILTQPELRAEWEREVETMRNRIATVRERFVQEMESRGAALDFGFLKHQRGMFSFSGVTDTHVEYLRKEKAVYLVKGGRINVAGLNESNLAYVCDSIAEALRRFPLA